MSAAEKLQVIQDLVCTQGQTRSRRSVSPVQKSKSASIPSKPASITKSKSKSISRQSASRSLSRSKTVPSESREKHKCEIEVGKPCNQPKYWSKKCRCMKPKSERKKSSKPRVKKAVEKIEEKASEESSEEENKPERDFDKFPLTAREKMQWIDRGWKLPKTKSPSRKSPKPKSRSRSRSPKPLANPLAGLFGTGGLFGNGGVLAGIMRDAQDAGKTKAEIVANRNAEQRELDRAIAQANANKTTASQERAVNTAKEERKEAFSMLENLRADMERDLATLNRAEKDKLSEADKRKYRQIKDRFYDLEYALKLKYPKVWPNPKKTRVGSRSRSRSRSR